MDSRLPAYLEVSAMIRRVNAEGGFATVLSKGEQDAGTILIVLSCNGRDQRLFERMPELDGTRRWRCSKQQDSENPFEFQEYLDRRKRQDPDVWVVELDGADPERFILP